MSEVKDIKIIKTIGLGMALIGFSAQMLGISVINTVNWKLNLILTPFGYILGVIGLIVYAVFSWYLEDQLEVYDEEGEVIIFTEDKEVLWRGFLTYAPIIGEQIIVGHLHTLFTVTHVCHQVDDDSVQVLVEEVKPEEDDDA